MRSRAVCLVFVAATLLVTSLTSTSSAQWRGLRQPGQKVLRVLGAGYGPGYHWRTPGPNSDYYNPYSAHNSLLISEPGPSGDFGAYSNNHAPAAGTPFSSHAPTSRGTTHLGDLPGAPIDGTFQPLQPNAEENQSGDDDAVDNDETTHLRYHTENEFRPASYPKTSVPKLNTPSASNDNDWSLTDPFADSLNN